ncbi:ATP-binding protein [Streptomyces macrosporus]
MTLGDARDSASTGPRLRAGAAYDGEPGSIADARQFVTGFLTRARVVHGFPVPRRTIDTARLVVSELVTNACKYAPGPCVLDLELDEGVLEVTVWDGNPRLPITRAAEPGRVGQHGLEIVLALCEGFDVRRDPVGKRIKVRIALGSETD